MPRTITKTNGLVLADVTTAAARADVGVKLSALFVNPCQVAVVAWHYLDLDEL
jgi:hypothetical protein